eukprot:jgi/Tetstr1/444542/TSEL_032419.t1
MLLAPRAIPVAPTPPPEGVPSNYITPADLLSSTAASIHRWGKTACRTHYITSYQGSKDHLNACGSLINSPMHYANRASPDGERRVETILGVTGRIRFMHAVQKACEHGDGGPALA